MKRILLLFSVLMLSCIALWAQKVEIDGIYYYLDETNKTAEVTNRRESYNSYANYAGSITIPETITYNAKTYSVTSIDNEAFRYSNLTSVTIPNSITTMKTDAFQDICDSTKFSCKIHYLGSIDEWVEINFENWASTPTTFAGNLYINNELLTDAKIKKAKSIRAYAFNKLKCLKSVEISNNVKSISENASFETCKNLTTFNYIGTIDEWAEIGTKIHGNLYINGELLTDIKLNTASSINDYAFYMNKYIRTIEIGNSVTNIGSYAFYECNSLTSIVIPNNITSIEDCAFQECRSLKEVHNYSNLDISKGSKEHGYVGFYANLVGYVKENFLFNEHNIILDYLGDLNITYLELPAITKGINPHILSKFTNLTSITIGSDVANLNSDVFSGCNNLKEINVSTENPNYCSENGVLFSKGKTELIIYPRAKTDISYTIPNSVHNINDGAFYGCLNLTSITIGSDVANLNLDVFSGCNNLKEINVSTENPNYCSENGVLFSKNKTELIIYPRAKTDISYTIPNSVHNINDGAFYGCKNLKNITIGNNIDFIGNNVFDYSGITSIHWNAKNYCKYGSQLPKIDNPGKGKVTICVIVPFKIPGGIVAPGTITDWYTDYGYNKILQLIEGTANCYAGTFNWEAETQNMFKIAATDENGDWDWYHELDEGIILKGDCSTDFRSNIEIYSDNQVIYILAKKFAHDSTTPNAVPFSNIAGNITSFTFGEDVESIPDNICNGMNQLTSIDIPNNVTSIGANSFLNCSGLTSFNIPNNVDYIGSQAFAGCSGLSSITIPKNVTYLGDRAFLDCTSLSSVEWNAITCNDQTAPVFKESQINQFTFGNEVQTIPAYLCSGMSRLDEITIPNTVTTIGAYAFSDCSSFTSVIVPNKVSLIAEGAFNNCSKLTNIILGQNVSMIENYAFSGCRKVREVTSYAEVVPETGYEEIFENYNANLYVPCDALEDYYYDVTFGSFKENSQCMSAEEVQTGDKVEIEVDDRNNATVTWPSNKNAKKYNLVISKDGEVVCTLYFNRDGRLNSIDFKRSASAEQEGFKFTVTGLEGASQYGYLMSAIGEADNVIEEHIGNFTTNGLVDIIETLADANITISNGLITCPEIDFAIYNTIGQDVTSFNGSLQPGVYLVSIENDIVKVMIK